MATTTIEVATNGQPVDEIRDELTEYLADWIEPHLREFEGDCLPGRGVPIDPLMLAGWVEATLLEGARLGHHVELIGYAAKLCRWDLLAESVAEMIESL